MISVIWSALVILFSLALFAYWFRYSCILILRTRTTTDFGASLAANSDLTFDQIQRELETEAATADLLSFRKALDRDYTLIASLLAKAPGIGEQFSELEQTMLRADYRVMQAWDGLSRRLLGQPSRRAITEMSAIVGFFANAAGEAGLLSSQA
jgi:hypothetical protein